jgi:cell division septation protein DedD
LRKRAYTLNLTFPMLLTTVIVVLIGVSWVFMFGVMVGRGYNPDAQINEITGRVLRGRQAPAVQEPPQAILRPEELDFGPALRDRSPHNASAAVGLPVAQPPAPQTNSTAVSSPPVAAGQAAQPPAQPAQQGTQPARFDFIYQAAAFREAGQADRLRARLEGEGVRTLLEESSAKGGKSLYKVLAVRRGTEEDVKQLLDVLESLRLGQPILRSKKPVGGGAR